MSLEQARHFADVSPKMTWQAEFAGWFVFGRPGLKGEPDEWQAGHVPLVPNIPVGLLRDRLVDLPTGRPIVVHCQSGARSAIAASVLRASGVPNVMNLDGGFAAWQALGLPVVGG